MLEYEKKSMLNRQIFTLNSLESSVLTFDRKHSKGFTLIELLLVLGIFVITVSLVVPAVTSGLETVRLRTTAKNISASLNYARNLAISERRIYYLRVFPDRLIVVAGKAEKLKKEISISERIKIKAIKGGDIFYSIKVEPSTGRNTVEAL